MIHSGLYCLFSTILIFSLFLPFHISHNTVKAHCETIRVSVKGWFNSLVSAGLGLQAQLIKY